jgi:hypothetical protein
MSGSVSLDQLRTLVLRNQAVGNSVPELPSQQVLVTREGKIVTGDAVRPDERRQLSVMPQEVFAVSLDELRAAVLQNQARGTATPETPSQQVLVDRDGKIVMGDEVSSDQRRRLSVMPQEIFAASTTRTARDRQTVNEKLPSNARYMEVGGVGGWLYSIVNEFNVSFMMFVYHDGSMYQVKVVEPEVEGRYSPHNGHLYSDGTICLSDDTGERTLERAYAKSVVWATGFTAFQMTGKFPFSINNLND